MLRQTPALLALCLLSLQALALPGEGQGSAPASAPPAAEPETVVLLDLAANSAAQDVVASVGSLLVNDLVESPKLKVLTARDVGVLLGEERARALLPHGQEGCDAPCIAEISKAAGSRYLVSGRLDRFGATFVLATDLFDSRTALSLAKPHATAANDADLPAAIHEVTGGLLSRITGAPLPGARAAEVAVSGPRVAIAFKGGSNFISSLGGLGPAADIEVGFRFHTEWVAFAEIGVAFVRAEGKQGPVGVNVVPSIVGVRHLYNVEHALQPYWGLGLGLQLSFGDFGPIERSGLLPTVVGFGGLQFLFTENVGALVELKTDLAQATLGVLTGEAGVALHLDLSLGLVFRF